MNQRHSPRDRFVRWTVGGLALLIVLGMVLAVIAPALAAPTNPHALTTSGSPASSSSTPGSTVLLGTHDLTWADVLEAATDQSQEVRDAATTLLARAGADEPINVITRAVGEGSCPADGWLGLGAGTRLSAGTKDRQGHCSWIDSWRQVAANAPSPTSRSALGILRETLDHSAASTGAVGRGARLALTDSPGTPPTELTAQDLADGARYPQLLLVDTADPAVMAELLPSSLKPGLTQSTSTPATPSTDAQRLISLVTALERVQQTGARAVVVSVADAASPGPQLGLLPAGTQVLRSSREPSTGELPGPAGPVKLLRSPATHQPGLIELSELTQSLIEACLQRATASAPEPFTYPSFLLPGRNEPRPAPDPAQGRVAAQALADNALHARAAHRSTIPTSLLLIAVSLLATASGAWLLRAGTTSKDGPVNPGRSQGVKQPDRVFSPGEAEGSNHPGDPSNSSAAHSPARTDGPHPTPGSTSDPEGANNSESASATHSTEAPDSTQGTGSTSGTPVVASLTPGGTLSIPSSTSRAKNPVAANRTNSPRTPSPRIALALAVPALLSPVGALATNLLPWWRVGARGELPSTVTVAAALTGTIAITAVLSGLLLGAWRLLRGQAWAAWAVTALAAACSLAATIGDGALGARLALNSPLGMSTVVAGRYYGVNNISFALGAGAFLVLVLALWSLLGPQLPRRLHVEAGSSRGRRTGAFAAVAVLGLPLLVADGAASLGADVGGALTLLPVLATLALTLAGLRLRWWHPVVMALVAAVVVLGFASLDWWVNNGQPKSHLGRFLVDLRQGKAGSALSRKAWALVEPFVSSWLPVVALLLGLLVLTAAAWWLRQALRSARAGVGPYAWLAAQVMADGAKVYQTDAGSAPIAATWGWLRPALITALVLVVAEVALNDSGVAMLWFSAVTLLPGLLALICASVLHPAPHHDGVAPSSAR
ncbi:Uncharacterised protein [Actinomyces bovis]|uniref:Beta-carotene 15,15'-monooxygenase n=1 Tax=Actinomyces bovis TaxID=1658 RepID=A0ABY1VR61_9ACTO|nr:hypothetical protein [Actinomyces bovis]SPT54459.1 Uncharacterised protein [Actinomyces bovis]VEG55920.1 Uncharacterised protein [Actinomyces israelii]